MSITLVLLHTLNNSAFTFNIKVRGMLIKITDCECGLYLSVAMYECIIVVDASNILIAPSLSPRPDLQTGAAVH